MPAAPPAGLQRQVTEKPARRVLITSLVGRSVLPRESPAAVGAQDRLQIVVGVGALVPAAAVADLKINNVLRAPIDQVVGVAGPCPKTSAHARLQDRLPLVRDQG